MSRPELPSGSTERDLGGRADFVYLFHRRSSAVPVTVRPSRSAPPSGSNASASGVLEDVEAEVAIAGEHVDVAVPFEDVDTPEVVASFVDEDTNLFQACVGVPRHPESVKTVWTHAAICGLLAPWGLSRSERL